MKRFDNHPKSGTLLPTHNPREVQAIEARWKRGEITPAEAHELIRQARREAACSSATRA